MSIVKMLLLILFFSVPYTTGAIDPFCSNRPWNEKSSRILSEEVYKAGDENTMEFGESYRCYLECGLLVFLIGFALVHRLCRPTVRKYYCIRPKKEQSEVQVIELGKK